jgi:hypothetical protein
MSENTAMAGTRKKRYEFKTTNDGRPPANNGNGPWEKVKRSNTTRQTRGTAAKAANSMKNELGVSATYRRVKPEREKKVGVKAAAMTAARRTAGRTAGRTARRRTAARNNNSNAETNNAEHRATMNNFANRLGKVHLG